MLVVYLKQSPLAINVHLNNDPSLLLKPSKYYNLIGLTLRLKLYIIIIHVASVHMLFLNNNYHEFVNNTHSNSLSVLHLINGL